VIVLTSVVVESTILFMPLSLLLPLESRRCLGSEEDLRWLFRCEASLNASIWPYLHLCSSLSPQIQDPCWVRRSDSGFLDSASASPQLHSVIQLSKQPLFLQIHGRLSTYPSGAGLILCLHRGFDFELHHLPSATRRLQIRRLSSVDLLCSSVAPSSTDARRDPSTQLFLPLATP
jgi:hypothetical protein